MQRCAELGTNASSSLRSLLTFDPVSLKPSSLNRTSPTLLGQWGVGGAGYVEERHVLRHLHTGGPPQGEVFSLKEEAQTHTERR